MDEVSKREIRAKRLVAAVLLAISVQIWSAPPLWAAEASVQAETSAAGEAKETKETKNAKAADSETGGEADADEGETVVVPVIGYSTRSAAGSDYGVMPLADMAVDGALTGVTSINDAKFYADSHDLLLGYDAKSQGTGTVALGSDANAGGQYSTAIGASASATAENSSALGMYARAGFKDSVAIGFSSKATADNMVSFGVTENGGSTWTTRRSLEGIANIDMHGGLTGVTGINNVTFILDEENSRVGIGNVDLPEDAYNGIAIGANTTVTASYGIAIGGASSALGENSIAIGSDAFAKAANGISLGEYAKVGEEHTGSVAIGSRSTTTAANQVSFGQWSSTKNEWTNRRSLAGISDIDMAGNISLGGEWDENICESNGKGELNGVTSINGVIFAKDSMNNQGGLLIGTLAPDTYYAGAWSVMIGTEIDNQAIDAVGIGNTITLTGDGSVAIGYGAKSLEDGVAIGFRSYAIGYDVVAIGSYSYSEYANSVALGSKSVAMEEKQVSFGHKADDKDSVGDTYGYNLFRSLTNVADIEMNGNISLGGTWDNNICESNGKGELNGVTSINGLNFLTFPDDGSMGLGVEPYRGDHATAFGYGTAFSDFSVVVGSDAKAEDTSGVAVGYMANTRGGAVAVGFQAEAMGSGSVALGSAASVNDDAEGGIAFGFTATVEHKNSVAVGAYSSTTAENQVAFGTGEVKTVDGKEVVTWSDRRSLAGISDIDMHGALTGVTTVNGATITGTGFNGVTLSADGKVNGAAITNNSFNGVTLEKGADNHYKVGGVDVSALKTTVDSISADGVGTADTAGIKRDTTGTATTSIETNTKISSSGITTNKVTVSGATATTLENGKLTVGAATVQNIGFAVGSSSLNNGSLTVDGNNKLTTAGLTASKVTVGAVIVSGGKVSGLTDAALSAVSTEAVTGKQLNATNTTVSALDTAYKAADTQIRTDFAAADTTLQNNIDAKVAQTAYDTKMSDLDSADTALGSRAAALETAVNDSTTGLAAVNTKVGALDTAYQAADTQIRTDFAAADTALKTELNTAIDEKAKKATDLAGYGITDAYTKTAADEKITAATADMATKTQVTADIGTAKTALESAYQAADTALSNRAAALETAATGMSYDAGKNTTTFTGGVTATLLTAGEFKVGATGFGFGSDGALTAKTVNGIEIKKDESKVMVGGIDLTALSKGDVVTDNTKGIDRNQDTATTTIETNTAISSSGITTNAVTASGTVKAGEFVEGSQKLSDKYAAKTALADYTTTTDMNTKFADYATTTAVDTKLADYAKSDSVYSKAAADTSFAKAGDVDTLKTTVGDADGGLVKDVKDLQSGKADNATTLAGYGIADAYTQTEINEKIVEATKDLATSATVTDIQSGLEEVTGKTAGLSYDTASGSSKFSGSVVIGNEGAKTHTQITDDAIIFGEGTDKQVTVDASGIHVGKKAAGGIALYADADGTHIDHTSLVTGSVTADNLNGVAISGNATDGLSVGGVSIKALSERLDSLEQDGVATADMGGIKRTDVVENSGKTIIEDTTSFTKDGLKTANLEAATAALGGVNFAAGAVTGVSSINGVVFGSDGKIGGVSLSGGKVDGVDVGWLDQRVKSLEDNGTGGGGTGGGGSSANTSGIHKPDGDTTNIEGNTSITTDGIDTNKVNASDAIVVADGEKNKTVISKDGILVAEGEKNQVKINEDGIHVGKNSSVVNDTDGFITDKGLYIGVSSSSDTGTAKFSVAPNGNLSSKAGDYGFSNTSADGAKFTHSGDTAYGTGSQLDTTIQGNKVTTGRVDTDELYVDGNKVTVAGGTIGQTDAVDNHLEGTDANGNTVTNDFKTSAVNGTTQAAEKTSADGKESTKTVNNTSAGGTSVTTSRTTTDSKDNVTVKESSFGTNEKGMTLSTSNKVTDKDGKVTKDTSGETKMTGDSISVSKTTKTTEKDADGNEKEVTKTSGTTIGSGEVTLKREDGSTIEVGSAIEGMQSDMHELDGRVSRMGVEIKEVGALSAALAGLHPQPENANSRADFAMAMGSYEGKQALAVGGFYRPDKRTMLSIGASTTSSKHMMNMGISIALDRLPEAERRAEESKTDLAGRMKMLEADYESRLEKLEAAYEARLERLEARYARLQEAAEDRKESAAEQPQAEKPAESEVKGDEADRAVS